MILFILAIFFIWLAGRELFNPGERRSGFSWAYMLVLLSLAVICALPQYKIWKLESFLSKKAAIIADRPDAKVKCNSIIGSIIDGRGTDYVAGTAYIGTGEIVFENGFCKLFMKYMNDPENASMKEVYAMQVYVHEVMHIRGERNEQKTECQAIQRHHYVSEMLGVDRSIARRDALRYYTRTYPRHSYRTAECKPGGKMDERLSYSIWDKN